MFSSKAHASTLNSNAKHRIRVQRVNDRQRQENVLCECVNVFYLYLFEERTYAGSSDSMVFWMPLVLNYMCFTRLNENDCRRLFCATTIEPKELDEEWDRDREAKSNECDQTSIQKYTWILNMRMQTCVRAVTKWRLKISTRKLSFDRKENKQKTNTRLKGIAVSLWRLIRFLFSHVVTISRIYLLDSNLKWNLISLVAWQHLELSYHSIRLVLRMIDSQCK